MHVRSRRDQEYERLPLILSLIGLVGYALPWVVATSAPMTLNAFDLAEWASLHPAQRHASPPLLAPLLLRTQLLILTVTFGAAASSRPWTSIIAVLVLILAAAQLPPFEYVYDIANLNYRQQFILALLSLLAGLTATRLSNRRIMRSLLVLLPVIGVVTAYAGLSQALDVYRQLQPVASIGLGPFVLVGCYLGILAAALFGSAVFDDSVNR